MKHMKLAAWTVLCMVLMSVTGSGQTPAAPDAPPAGEGEMMQPPGFSIAPPPLTRLEAFGSQRGVLVIKGFTDVGHLAGDDGSSVRVMAVEFSDVARKVRERGLAIHVTQNVQNSLPAETISYVDEEEVDALIENVAALGKLQANVSPMESFEARYQTRGELELANVRVGGGRMISVRGAQFFPTTGQPIFATASFFPGRMEELHQRLDAARQVLARLKQQG
jgi:hypothetical protein